MTTRFFRSLSVASLPLLTGGWLVTAMAEPEITSGGLSYSYLDEGYQWVDSNYGITQQGGQHHGLALNGSVGLAKFGRTGLHVFGQLFAGQFAGAATPCEGSNDIPTTSTANRDSQSIAGGLGLSFSVVEDVDLVARVAYVDVNKFQIPNNLCQLVNTDDHGYSAEAAVRGRMSENVEVDVSVRYSDLTDSALTDTQVSLSVAYALTDYLSLRARGIVFDTETGIELGARVYFGSLMGRDTVF